MNMDTSFKLRLFGRTLPLRRSGVLGVGGALAFSGLSLLAASSFARKPPAGLAPPGSMSVGNDSVTLSAGAPQWNVLQLGSVTRAAEHWTDPVTARVRIDETRAARVGSPLAGRVAQVFIELGQHVKKGDPLFSVTSTDLAALRSDASKAAVDLDVARAQYQRVHDMVESRLLPGKDELSAAAEKHQAELALRGAEAKIRALKVAPKRDDEFTVTAPRDGVIVDKNLLAAQEVGTDGTLVQIADVSRVWVVADVFESDAAGLRPGTPTRIDVPSRPGKSIDAAIESVSAVVDPDRHSVPVRVQLDNPEGLRPNEFAEMRFRVALPDGTVEVAATALVSDGATQYVFVEEAPGKLVRRKVVAGPVRDGKVAVTQGLKLGEKVVERGGILLDNQIDLAH